jgi:hypothetical protein
MYVSVQISDGFGNQMFKVAAMLGYAQRHGHQPIFLEEPKPSKDHPNTTLSVRTFFPTIPIIPEAIKQAWTVLQEPAGASMTYLEFPAIQGNVYLKGYFQSEQYFPKVRIPFAPNIVPQCIELFANDWSSTFFLHIRRGDYMHPANAHHTINVYSYLQKSLVHFSEALTCFVVSDDIIWCKTTLPTWFSRKWLFCPDATDAETLYWMSLCAGGICANSSFSWWAAYFLKQDRDISETLQICMPFPWGKPPLPEARNLIPEWATSIQWL